MAASRVLTAAFDARDPDRVAGFWTALLGRQAVADGDDVLLPGEGGQLGLRFTASATEQVGPNDMHLHVTSTDEDDQRRLVAAALDLGAAHLDVGQRGDEGHIVLGDPERNAFCVIEPDNSFLAGCGLLGEVACDGSRAVGVFWSEVLGWPLVWDENDETAIQAPVGGTKVAWGGATASPKTNRQRLELVVSGADRDTELDRLVSLGATLLDASGDIVRLADPDGTELVVRSAPARYLGGSDLA